MTGFEKEGQIGRGDSGFLHVHVFDRSDVHGLVAGGSVFEAHTDTPALGGACKGMAYEGVMCHK